MSRATPTRWLRDKATEGLAELPANAAWLLSKAFADSSSTNGNDPHAESGPASALRSGAHRVRSAAASAIPGV